MDELYPLPASRAVVLHRGAATEQARNPQVPYARVVPNERGVALVRCGSCSEARGGAEVEHAGGIVEGEQLDGVPDLPAGC